MSTNVTSRFLTCVVLALVLVVPAAPCMGGRSGPARPVTIVAAAATITDGLDPNDQAWTAATGQSVALDTIISAAGLPNLLPSRQWRFLQVKAIHDGTDIFFRYEWTDSTESFSVADAPTFADALAMEIPVYANSSIAMGNPPTQGNPSGEPVNIIFWRADLPNPQNIIAGGAGTVHKTPDSDDADMDPVTDPPTPLVTHSQIWENGTWTVILQRPLIGNSMRENVVDLVSGGSYRICFAQWDGGNQERDGVKMVAGSWQTLYLNNE